MAKVVHLRPAEGIPEHPHDFGIDAVRLWVRIWTSGARWIAPATDMEAVEQTCRMADALGTAQRRYAATTDAPDMRVLIQAHKALNDMLAALGFTPTARTRLGVAEVTAISKLDKFRRDQAGNK